MKSRDVSSLYDQAEDFFGKEQYLQAARLFDEVIEENETSFVMNDYAYYYRACIYAWEGNEKKAIEYLEKALLKGATVWRVLTGKDDDDGLHRFKTGHFWDPYRQTPGFQKILTDKISPGDESA